MLPTSTHRWRAGRSLLPAGGTAAGRTARSRRRGRRAGPIRGEYCGHVTRCRVLIGHLGQVVVLRVHTDLHPRLGLSLADLEGQCDVIGQIS